MDVRTEKRVIFTYYVSNVVFTHRLLCILSVCLGGPVKGAQCKLMGSLMCITVLMRTQSNAPAISYIPTYRMW